LSELLPSLSVFGFLRNPQHPNAEGILNEVQVAAQKLRRKVLVFDASSDEEITSAFGRIVEQNIGGLLIGGDPFFLNRRKQVMALILHYSVPAVCERNYADVGALISYGGSVPDAYRIAGLYVGRILSGEKASQLPVQQATTIEMIVNLRTAKTLGVEVPQSLLARADEVIE